MSWSPNGRTFACTHQITGLNLAVVAKFFLPDGRSTSADFEAILDNGLAP